jgi:hypothetical protein
MNISEPRQGSFLDASSVQETSENGALFFVTNSTNIYEIVPTGLLSARAGLQRYEPDLLELGPGRVPLFTREIPACAISAMAGGLSADFPVALEFAPDLFGGKYPGIDLRSGKKGTYTSAQAVNQPTCMAVPLVVPVSVATACHVRTESDRDELLARLDFFPNVRSEAISCIVSEELFSGTGDAVGLDLADWLRSLRTVSRPSAVEFDRESRLLGALAMMLRAIPGSASWVALFTDLTSGARVPVSRRRKSPAPWLHGLLTSITGEDPFYGSGSDPDEALFSATLGVLRDVDPHSGFRSVELIQEIFALARNRVSRAEDQRRLDASEERFLAILNNEQELRFPSAPGLPVARALILFLLRRTPEQVLTWFDDNPGASLGSLVTAAMFSGALHGWTELDVGTRGELEREQYLAAWSASRLGKYSRIVATPPQPGPLEVDVRAGEEAEREVRLLSRGRVVWSSTMDHRTRLLESRLDEEPMRSVAMTLARRMGWDCIRSEVALPAGKHRLEVRKGRTKLIVEGELSVEFLLDEQAFRERLERADVDDLVIRQVVDGTIGASGAQPFER